MTKIRVFDSEGDNLAYTCTKLHILSYTEGTKCGVCLGEGTLIGGPDTYGKTCTACSGSGHEVFHTDSYDTMRSLLTEPDVLWVGHNAVMHDMVAFNRILGLSLTYQSFVDTLALSWVLWPERSSHGLGSFQEESGLEKPQVDDWQDVTYEQMKHRCGSDVLLNWWLWQKQVKRLKEIYG